MNSYINNMYIKIKGFILNNLLLTFYLLTIIYLELIYCLWVYKGLNFNFIFTLLFSIPAAIVLFFISNLFKPKINKILSFTITCLLSIVFCVYLVYFKIFKTTLSVYSFVGTKDALQFKSVISSAILSNLIAIIIFIVPIIVISLKHAKFNFSKKTKRFYMHFAAAIVVSFTVSIISIHLTSTHSNSPYALYYKVSDPNLTVRKIGLITTIRLDIQRLIFGFNERTNTISSFNETHIDSNLKYSPCNQMDSSKRKPSKSDPYKRYNITDIRFATLSQAERDKAVVDMHNYFSTIKPTEQNAFTGLFEGHNLILITAEAFYPYAISPELTPTLYKMATEGFVFNNFYNPLWGVSTSDGEYAACMGLLPKAGVWSMAQSSKNYLPFALGNQFRALGYLTKAYHNHTYSYYDRHKSHPNMGYDYKGRGNGLRIKEAWPESDLEMMQISGKEYIPNSPFHAYYMTVSGHFEYNFVGNHMAIKNQKYVKDLPFSDLAKAYIACNLEFEFAMQELVRQLEELGIAENTVIAISPDHYPYGLPKENIDELVGHEVESHFEIYKSSFILWKKGMTPITIEKPCSSVDILPTLSNLFGLKYDSRLLVGKDILSTAKPLVIFKDRSWINEKGKYNSLTSNFIGESAVDSTYIDKINKLVEEKFYYSAKILEKNYYQKVFTAYRTE